MTLSYLVGKRNAHTTLWTEELTARLVELWSQGYTAEQIAKIFSPYKITRAGVLTKARRLKLPRRRPGRRKRQCKPGIAA